MSFLYNLLDPVIVPQHLVDAPPEAARSAVLLDWPKSPEGLKNVYVAGGLSCGWVRQLPDGSSENVPLDIDRARETLGFLHGMPSHQGAQLSAINSLTFFHDQLSQAVDHAEVLLDPEAELPTGNVHVAVERDLQEVDTETATELREYVLLQDDLETAIEVATIWGNRFSGKPDKDCNGAEAVALYQSAILRFVSCFDRKQQRLMLDATEIYGLYEGALEGMRDLRDLRDSQIAHRYGAGRQCVVGVLLDSDGNVLGDHHLVLKDGPAKPDEWTELVQFMEVALEFVKTKVASGRAKLLEEARQMGREQRLALPVAAVRGLGPGLFHLSRGKLRKRMGQDKRAASSTIETKIGDENSPSGTS